MKPGATSPRPRVQIVCNPLSGTYSDYQIAGLANAYGQHGFETVISESSPRVPFAPDPTAQRICIAGGDGTVRHALAHPHLNAGGAQVDIFPAGTINLVVREVGGTREPKDFVDMMMSRPPRSVYPVSINDTIFLVCASVGPDARAVAGVSDELKGRIGRFAYVVSMLRELLDWHRPSLLLEIGQETVPCEAVYIAKGRYYAGSWSFAPEARLDQPDLHILALKKARRRDFLAFLFALAIGRAERLSNIRTFRTRTAVVKGNSLLPVQADGDVVAHLPIDVRCFDVPAIL